MNRNQKKIMYVITKSNWGGAQRYVFDLATVARNHYACLVALGGKGPLTHRLHEAGVPFVSIPSLQRDIGPLKELRSFIALFKLIRDEKPQILHVNSAKAGGLGALCGRILRVPCIIFTAHGWEFNNTARGWIYRFLITLLSWFTVLLSHKTIAVSYAVRKQMNWPFVSHKILVVHNGHTPHRHLSKKEARAHLMQLAPSLRPFQNDLWSGTIAELHPIKRHDAILAAFQDPSLTKLGLRHIVIGDGELAQKLQTEVSEQGLQDRIFFVGHVSDAATLLLAYDVFTLTSESEGLAYALLEAGAAGVPCIASNVGGIPEIIEHEKNGLLIDPNDTSSIVHALVKMAKSPKLRAAYGRALQKKVLHEFTLKDMCEKTLRVYDQS